jgi:hypothetical protein
MTRQEQKAPARGTVRLRRFGQFLQVAPPCEELRQALRTSRHALQRGPVDGLFIGRVAADLFRETTDLDEPVMECFVGLLPAVHTVLRSAGWRVETRFRAAPPLPAPELQAVAESGPCDRGLLGVVRCRERALVRYATKGADASWLIAELALTWPKLTFAVAVSRIEEARVLRCHLLRHLPDVTAVTSRDRVADEQVGRVVVATYNALGHTGIEIEKRDVVIALDAVEASSPEALSRLGHARRARVYGLLTQERSLSRYEEDTLRLLFGFAEVEVIRHGDDPLRVEVVRCRGAGGPPLPCDLGSVEVKRRGIWHNGVRNRLLARLARRASGSNDSGVMERFPTLALALRDIASPRVVVLVENVEHALSLARHLAGWQIVAGPELWKEDLSAKAEKAVKIEAEKEDSPAAIVTRRAAEAIPLAGVDVLIRGDGGTGQLSEAQFFSRKRIGSAVRQESDYRKCLLVDLDDRCHPLLRRWSRQRWAAYAEQGWFPTGVDPEQARVEQFLATRPTEGCCDCPLPGEETR